MREKISALLCSLFLFFVASTHVAQANTTKDWTFLVFLNGNNNLDTFGTLNINQMEMVGSSDKVNVVVQWASYRAQKVTRLLVQKDNDPKKVTSPIVQDLGKVDMGDWRNLVEFIRWGAANYPANHYAVAVWDHGSGWHQLQVQGQAESGKIRRGFHPTDISWDDYTGNFMTTKQLGQAISEGARAIGHKIDIYGSDACLMAMGEVAGEMKDSVQYYVGSQDLEPGAGWPYDQILKRWTATRGSASPRDVATIMVQEYTKSYQGGSNGTQEVTSSAYDLSKLPAFEQAVSILAGGLAKLDANDRRKVVAAAKQAQKFTYEDYGDLVDFLVAVGAAKVGGLGVNSLTDVKAAFDQLVVANSVTQSWKKAHGLSIWMPYTMSSYNEFASKYGELSFQSSTHWGDAMRFILQDARR